MKRTLIALALAVASIGATPAPAPTKSPVPAAPAPQFPRGMQVLCAKFGAPPPTSIHFTDSGWLIVACGTREFTVTPGDWTLTH